MSTPRKPTDPTAKAVAEVQAKSDEQTQKGFIGHVPDENPNAAYSLLTGPDAPPLVPDSTTSVHQHASTPKEA